MGRLTERRKGKNGDRGRSGREKMGYTQAKNGSDLLRQYRGGSRGGGGGRKLGGRKEKVFPKVLPLKKPGEGTREAKDEIIIMKT